MNATVTALPTTRLVSVPRRQADVRKLLLAWVACEVAEGRKPPRALVADILSLYADPALGAEGAREAWEEYRLAVTEEQESADGPVSWHDLAPYDGRGPCEPVAKIARTNAACALADLAGKDGAP